MFFDALWNIANKVIKDLSFDSPTPPTSLEHKLWMSPPMPRRAPLAKRQSPSMEISPDALSSSGALPFIRSSVFMEKGGSEDEAENQSYTRFRSHSLFDREALEGKPLSQKLSEEDDFDYPVPLHHPQPQHPLPVTSSSTTFHLIQGYISSPRIDHGTPPPQSHSPEITLSRSPSLVPTVIISRPPSPRPHPCVARAQESGIKVRDFAYEDHGVQVAPPVPDIDQHKARYYLYRTAGLNPPPEVVSTLKDLEPEWLADAERQFVILSSQKKSKSGNPILTWRRETERWRGFEEPVLVDQFTPDDSDVIEEITEDMEIELVNDV